MDCSGRNLKIGVIQNCSSGLERRMNLAEYPGCGHVIGQHRDCRQNTPFDVVEMSIPRGRAERSFVELSDRYGTRELSLTSHSAYPLEIPRQRFRTQKLRNRVRVEEVGQAQSGSLDPAATSARRRLDALDQLCGAFPAARETGQTGSRPSRTKPFEQSEIVGTHEGCDCLAVSSDEDGLAGLDITDRLGQSSLDLSHG